MSGEQLLNNEEKAVLNAAIKDVRDHGIDQAKLRQAENEVKESFHQHTANANLVDRILGDGLYNIAADMRLKIVGDEIKNGEGPTRVSEERVAVAVMDKYMELTGNNSHPELKKLHEEGPDKAALDKAVSQVYAAEAKPEGPINNVLNTHLKDNLQSAVNAIEQGRAGNLKGEDLDNAARIMDAYERIKGREHEQSSPARGADHNSGQLTATREAIADKHEIITAVHQDSAVAKELKEFAKTMHIQGVSGDGQLTTEEIKNIQKALHTKADGAIGENTLRKMEETERVQALPTPNIPDKSRSRST